MLQLPDALQKEQTAWTRIWMHQEHGNASHAASIVVPPVLYLKSL